MKVTEQGLLDKLGESYLKITLTEDVDARLKRLAREGLIEKDEYALFLKTMKDLERVCYVAEASISQAFSNSAENILRVVRRK